jgi:hypothetical protein
LKLEQLKIIGFAEQKEKKMTESEQNLINTIKHTNINIGKVPEEERKGQRYFKNDQTAENFLILMKGMNINI